MARLDLVTSVPDRSALSAGLGRLLTLKNFLDFSHRKLGFSRHF